MSKSRDFEVAVIGGGPAGLSCALWLGRYRHKTVLIDGGDPRNWETTGVNGFLGLPRVRPAALRRRGRAECRRYKVKLADECVDQVRRNGDEDFEMQTDAGNLFRARRLVLAIGLVDRWPDLPGLEHCYGLSAHHCTDCDGFEAVGKKTVVIGHGRKAAAMAFALLTWTDQIIICSNGEPCNLEPAVDQKLKKFNVPVVQTKVKWVHSEERHIKYLDLQDGMQIDAQKLFFVVEHLPADDLGVQLGCKRDDNGLILVDATRRTSVEHVYAVGDITPGAQLAITAAADGAVAAAAIHRSLLPEDRRL
jgi:thioredoxin reductase